MGKGLYEVRVSCSSEYTINVEAMNEDEAMDIAEHDASIDGPEFWDTEAIEVECIKEPTTPEEDVMKEDAKRQLPLFQ